MPTKKVRDLPMYPQKDKFKICLNPEHNPPGYQVFSPGVYEHTCPGCGHTVSFTIYPTHNF